MWVASTHSRAGLMKLEKQGWVFYGFCMIRKALGLMEIGPREATQGESQIPQSRKTVVYVCVGVRKTMPSVL